MKNSKTKFQKLKRENKKLKIELCAKMTTVKVWEECFKRVIKKYRENFKLLKTIKQICKELLKTQENVRGKSCVDWRLLQLLKNYVRS